MHYFINVWPNLFKMLVEPSQLQFIKTKLEICNTYIENMHAKQC